MALSEEQLETVKARWTVEGDSAGRIAADLGVTRNVVIGVIHRRGWQQAGAAARPRARLPSAPRLPAPSRPARPGDTPLPPEKAPPFELDPSKFVTIDQLGRHHCRYPVGDRQYCGLMPNETPYCDGHAKIVYQPRPEKPRKGRR